MRNLVSLQLGNNSEVMYMAVSMRNLVPSLQRIIQRLAFQLVRSILGVKFPRGLILMDAPKEVHVMIRCSNL
jgi:hypothetical protein